MVMVSGDRVVVVSFRLCHLIVALARDVAHAPSILPQLLHVNGHVCSLVPGCFRWIFWKHCHRYSLRLVLFHGHISSHEYQKVWTEHVGSFDKNSKKIIIWFIITRQELLSQLNSIRCAMTGWLLCDYGVNPVSTLHVSINDLPYLSMNLCGKPEAQLSPPSCSHLTNIFIHQSRTACDPNCLWINLPWSIL